MRWLGDLWRWCALSRDHPEVSDTNLAEPFASLTERRNQVD
jgi:hypothetical protein